MANVPPRVAELIETFDRNIDAYRSQQYNEAQLRREFIDPFFEELGWDVTNIAGNAQAYKDVIHEDAIKVGSATKAPDYSFRIGGVRKFFLEAKKPSIDIKGDPHPAYQLRRYAWSAKLPLSILTDFEEFAVYDCQTRPKQTDRAGTARIMYLNYKEYIKRWSDIENIFSKDAIYKGSFDKFAVSTKGKRGTTTVDKEFLEEIEKWREQLAKIIAHRNRTLTVPQINFAVQRTIDRIIFLRMAEDRGIEQYSQLLAIVSGDHTYPRLCKVFEQADAKYNSGLFHFREEKGRSEPPDELTLNLVIDDKDLKYILNSLYYPQSPYEFSVLPPEILGNVYEQFLGKVIQVSPGRRVKIEEKPEVKKAGGVYYTPAYIVDYIVKNTVGKLLGVPDCHCEERSAESPAPGRNEAISNKLKTKSSKLKTPKQISNLRILDPACGSGSFLLGAYTYLLNYHRDWYVENDPEKHTKKIYQGKGGQWYLTIAEKKQILLNNIFGVDIDSQAVEVTKLSLLLKVLEGETSETIGQTYKIFHERALPDLGNNIKCGNSLIGPDFFDTLEPKQRTTNNEQRTTNNEQRTNSDDLYRKINPFDYKAEFPHIFKTKNPGFHAVIGNPPYGMVGVTHEKTYFDISFEATEGRFDNYELFIEKGIKLCKSDGLLGFIVPSPLLSNLYAQRLRQQILHNCSIREIVNFGMSVFSDPTVHTCIIILSRGRSSKATIQIRKQVCAVEELSHDYDYSIPQNLLGRNKKATFDIFVDPDSHMLVDKIGTKARSLGDICFIRQCIKTGNDKEYVKSFDSNPPDPWKPTLRGRNIARYTILDRTLYVKYGKWLARNWKNRTFYETPKIAIRETGKQIVAALDLENRYFLSSLYAIYPRKANEMLSLKYILGLLNSNLATYFVKIVAFDLTKGAFTKMRTNQLARFPIRTIDFNNPADKAKHDKMVKLVERMLDLHKKLSKAKVPAEKTRIQRQINTTDKQIDKLTYDLYGLTKEEIAIVEGSNQRS